MINNMSAPKVPRSGERWKTVSMVFFGFLRTEGHGGSVLLGIDFA